MSKTVLDGLAMMVIALGAIVHRTPSAPVPTHPTTHADLAVMRDARPTIVGVAIRWCVSQDACSSRPVRTARGAE